ncbi:MAG: hypothetical protein U0744_06375 [Gemmataceae bacterium]
MLSQSLPVVGQPTLPGVLDVPFDELKAWLAEQGEKPMRVKQIRRWLLVAGVDTFEAMSDLPRPLRAKLTERFAPLSTRIVRHLQADDDTHKLLLKLHDGHLVECVLIQEEGRRTACISTQVGCGMGCVFCASGLNGVERNLTVGEIVEHQARFAFAAERPQWPAATAEPIQPGSPTTRFACGMAEPACFNLDNLVYLCPWTSPP